MEMACEAIDEDDGEVEGVEFRLDPKDIFSTAKWCVGVDVQEPGSKIFVGWRAAA